MRELTFSLIYAVIGAGLLAAYYFNEMEVFALLTVLYFIVLMVDYTND